MNKLWYYISYPLRYLLRHKVERYRKELEKIQNSQIIIAKARRHGMTATRNMMALRRQYFIHKYEKFINKWRLK